jgi:antitoxin ParD1/3/4/toxin ParE1/3/4
VSGYRLTESAEADLDDILGFIAERDGLSRALHVYQAFVEAFDLLADTPYIGPRKPHLTDDPIRWWPVFRFLIVYDPEREPIDILRVIHGARELEHLFKRGETDR